MKKIIASLIMTLGLLVFSESTAFAWVCHSTYKIEFFNYSKTAITCTFHEANGSIHAHNIIPMLGIDLSWAIPSGRTTGLGGVPPINEIDCHSTVANGIPKYTWKPSGHDLLVFSGCSPDSNTYTNWNLTYNTVGTTASISPEQI